MLRRFTANALLFDRVIYLTVMLALQLWRLVLDSLF